jgi:hypothetical protein
MCEPQRQDAEARMGKAGISGPTSPSVILEPAQATAV